MTTEPTALLRRTEAYLSALHGSVARHDNLAANLACAGCELRDEIRAALAAEAPTSTRTADPLAGSATEYRVPVPEAGGTDLIVRRQALVHGAGWAVSTSARGGGRAWTAEGWQDSISALSVDRLFCWPDAETAVTEARRALAAGPQS